VRARPAQAPFRCDGCKRGPAEYAVRYPAGELYFRCLQCVSYALAMASAQSFGLQLSPLRPALKCRPKIMTIGHDSPELLLSVNYRPIWAAALDPAASVDAVVLPGIGTLSRADALAFAAWIVALIAPPRATFEKRVAMAKRAIEHGE